MRRTVLVLAAAAWAARARAQATLPASTDPPAPSGGTRPTTQTLFRQEAFVLPPYAPLRWNEDYSYLRDPSRRDDYLDGIKYVPLGRDDVYLSLGGQFRERYEYFNHNLFGVGAQDRDGYYLTRVLLHADVHVGENLRFYVEGKSSSVAGREGGPRSSVEDEADLEQAFVDVRVPWTDSFATTFRPGRQEMYLGAGRLVDQIEWSNVRRTFDGLRVTHVWKGDGWWNTLDLFVVRPVRVEAYEFNESDPDRVFAGAHDSVSLPKLIEDAGSKIELYLLSNSQRKSALSKDDAQTYMAGARFYTNPKPWDLDVEGGYQFGNHDSSEVRAGMFAAEAGVTLADTGVTPRPFVGFDYASGDDAGGAYTRYYPYYPSGHRFTGQIDNFERANLIGPSVGLDLVLLKDAELARRVALRAQYMGFWRASDGDGLFTSTGNPVARAGGTSRSRFVGHEVDLILSWQVDRHVLASSGYSHLFAGGYVHDTDGGDGSKGSDVDYLYFQLQYTF